jgi:HD-GYP domain-containing protein (c-di-GMP phosphodiesterase class II)
VGTPLHDIGKIGIEDSILRKPGKLTEEEFEIMKTHTIRGYEILKDLPDMGPCLPIVRNHHERWDGKGYPDGLAGERIPKLARIVAVADAFDAMTTDRPYRPALPLEVAFAEIRDKAGTQFDPDMARAFLRLRPKIEEALQHPGSEAETLLPQVFNTSRNPADNREREAESAPRQRKPSLTGSSSTTIKLTAP